MSSLSFLHFLKLFNSNKSEWSLVKAKILQFEAVLKPSVIASVSVIVSITIN